MSLNYTEVWKLGQLANRIYAFNTLGARQAERINRRVPEVERWREEAAPLWRLASEEQRNEITRKVEALPGTSAFAWLDQANEMLGAVFVKQQRAEDRRFLQEIRCGVFDAVSNLEQGFFDSARKDLQVGIERATWLVNGRERNSKRNRMLSQALRDFIEDVVALLTRALEELS